MQQASERAHRRAARERRTWAIGGLVREVQQVILGAIGNNEHVYLDSFCIVPYSSRDVEQELIGFTDALMAQLALHPLSRPISHQLAPNR